MDKHIEERVTDLERRLGLLGKLGARTDGPEQREPTNCHDCGAKPGEMHRGNCDVERCSVCGGQRLQCNCEGHDRGFARWSGWWPGWLEAQQLGIDLNEFERQGWARRLFVKPVPDDGRPF